MSVKTLITPTLKSSFRSKNFILIKKIQIENGKKNRGRTGNGEMFDEIVHARFASAGHAQCDQNGHVANDDEDQQNPQKG